MKTSGCSLLWQAEAIEDGRLSAADAATFERHAVTCPSCARMVRSLAELRSHGQSLPIPSLTELEHRRARQQMLNRAHDLSVGAGRWFRWRYLWGLPALLVAAGLLVWLRAKPTSPSELALDVPDYRLAASEDARFHVLERTSTVRIAIEVGRFQVQVTKLHPPQRFVLEMPDGQVEVEGTRFVLDVAADGARSIQVEEGRVALRLSNQTTRLLVPGQPWSAPAVRPVATTPEPTAANPARPDVSAPLSPSEKASIGAAGGRAVARPRALLSTAREVSKDQAPSPEEADPGSAGPTFANAMSAFSAGDYRRAEQLFLQFERDHPTDSRAEDAAFLRSVSRWRRGDAAGARALAAKYLQRYPSGLRRREAERLVED